MVVKNRENLNREKLSIEERFYALISKNPLNTITWIVIISGFIIRLSVSLQALGIYHPDEIFQSLEMAHYITYDSANIPPEFRKENPSKPSYSASRSWLFPLFFAAIMEIGEFLNLDYHTGIFPLIRIVLAINATLLIPATKKFVTVLTNNENAGMVAAIFVAYWWRVIEISVRPFTNSFFLPMLFYGLYRLLLVLKIQKKSNYDTFIITIFVGLTTYIRLDLGIIVFSIFLVTFNLDNIKLYFALLFDGITGWIIGILVDYSYYDRLFTVPVNWATFALKYGDIFGVQDRYYYYDELVKKDGLSIWILPCIILFLIVLYKIGITWLFNYNLRHTNISTGYLALFLSNLVTWLIFSNFWEENSHKELRFMLGGTIVLLMVIAVAIVLVVEIIIGTYENIIEKRYKINLLHKFEYRYWSRIVLISFLCFIMINKSIQFDEKRGYIESYDDINLAFIYVGNQENVTGVIAIVPWFLSGSYTYLHLGPEVIIRYADLRNTVNYKANNKSLVQLILYWKQGNYLVFPRYQLSGNGHIIDLLINNDWEISTVIDGRTDVWHKR